MNRFVLSLLIAAGLTLGACSGLGSLAYCIAVDNNANLKCQ